MAVLNFQKYFFVLTLFSYWIMFSNGPNNVRAMFNKYEKSWFFSCENGAIIFKQKTDYAKLCCIGCFCCIRCRKTHDFAEGRRFRFNERPFFPKSFFFPKIILFFQKSFNKDLGARQTPSADFTERVFFPFSPAPALELIFQNRLRHPIRSRKSHDQS